MVDSFGGSDKSFLGCKLEGFREKMGDNGEDRSSVDSRGLFGSGAEPSGPAVSVSVKKKSSKKLSFDEEDFIVLLHGSDPVKIELNRLQNEVKEKERELAEAHSEIKGLRLTERAKDKALAEVTEELKKTYEKLQASEAALENKKLEIKKTVDEKKEALVAQFAAEATLRRVHAAQKDEDLLSIEDILSPLEAEIKLLRQEISKLQDDNRALERLTKSKEIALLDAEQEVQLARIKAALVDDLQNKNMELMKQNEICQEEYKILDKMHRQKVAEVEKLGQTIRELEEALLSGAAAANAVRDYQRQVNELKGEKRTLERTLARAMATENRIAAVFANEWRDANDKVMPVKQWLEERRILMGEMQQLRDKLSIVERTAKAEAQLKERLQLRLKVIEDGLKSSLSSGTRCDTRSIPNGLPRSRSLSGADHMSSTNLANGMSMQKSSSPILRSPTSSTILKHAKGASKSFDGGNSSEEKYLRSKPCADAESNNSPREEIERVNVSRSSVDAEREPVSSKLSDSTLDDFVSVVLYDILQKEVISLRKSCNEKDQFLEDKDNSIEILSKKIDTLTKAMEVETKKQRREKAALEKEVADLIEKQNLKERRLKRIVSNLHH